MSEFVFLSYLREDVDLVRDVRDRLQRQNVKIWMDEAEIAGGEKWERAIAEAIGSAKHVILCFSANYEARPDSYMSKEIELAVTESNNRLEKKHFIIPLLITGMNIPRVQLRKNTWLSDLNVIRLKPNRNETIADLVATMNAATAHELRNDPFVEQHVEPLRGDGYRYSYELDDRTYEWSLSFGFGGGRRALLRVTRFKQGGFLGLRRLDVETLMDLEGEVFYTRREIVIYFNDAGRHIHFRNVRPSGHWVYASFADPFRNVEMDTDFYMTDQGHPAVS